MKIILEITNHKELVAAKDFLAAMAAVQLDVDRKSEPGIDVDLPIEELKLSTLTTNTLKNSQGIVTIRDLIGKSRTEVAGVVGFGRRSLWEIEAALDNYGLTLRQSK